VAKSPTSPTKQSFPADQKHTSDFSEKLDVMAKERDLLLQQVAELRKSLEEISVKHQSDIDQLQTRLQDAESGKQLSETLHNNLKERVTTITASLGERMRANKVRAPLSLERLTTLNLPRRKSSRITLE
jgi:vacuolar-type H+-ATPase subunit D/Vma8